MSLNAVVYCDCIEKGRIRIPHPNPALLYIDKTGYPNISSDDPLVLALHDHWESCRPCEHNHFWLIEHWLGNTSLIGSIREMVDQSSSTPDLEYPILWTKVIFSGSHSGDFLTIEDVGRLKEEVGRLERSRDLSEAHAAVLGEFLMKVQELVQASLSVGKPISF